MLKFLRKYRQKLIPENRFSRYLLYAIGEIILVVIGILIALQINNWNDTRKKILQESVYLENIKGDLQTQIESLEGYISFQDIIIEDAKVIVKHYEENNGFINMDTVYTYLNDLAVRSTFINNNTSLTELINSGEINIIRNTGLKRALLEFNQSVLTFMSITQNNNTNLIDMLIVPAMIENSFRFDGYTDKMNTYLSSQTPEVINYTLKRNAAVEKELEKTLSDPGTALDILNKSRLRYGLANMQKQGNIQLREKAQMLLSDVKKELDRR